MQQIGKTGISPLVWKAFLRLLPVQIIEIIVFAVNTFADSLITGRFLGRTVWRPSGYSARWRRSSVSPT